MKTLILIVATIAVFAMIGMLFVCFARLAYPVVGFQPLLHSNPDVINTGKCYISIKGEKRWVFVSNGEIEETQTGRR